LKTAIYCHEGEWQEEFDRSLDSQNTLLLLFGALGRNAEVDAAADEICRAFPKSLAIGSSDAGAICDDKILENGLVAAVCKLDNSQIKMAETPIGCAEDSKEAGRRLAEALKGPKLKGIFVLSEGLEINGSELAEGLREHTENGVVVSGGLAADDDRFKKTFILSKGSAPQSKHIAAVGFYGDAIHIAADYRGGWDPFGIERKVTSSSGNVLFTLDNEPALALYKRYLGKYADHLPASGLLFPLGIRGSKEESSLIVRTILSIDEKRQSITFAGDIPEGHYATFMKSNPERLIDGAYDAAGSLMEQIADAKSGLCIAISCVGRRLLLKNRSEEELEAIMETLPEGTRQVGFYSYSEISGGQLGSCDLHNHTMTLTLIWETDA
jgi:hypothetical protein